MSFKNKKGFTLIEILLVVALIAILAGIVILAINPGKQIQDTNNSQRRVDVRTIMDAIYQYATDNDGDLPSNIGQAGSTCGAQSNLQEICKTGGSCSNLVDVNVLTTNATYLTSIPTDPTGATSNGTGYYAVLTSNGRVTVCAPSAQQSETISITR
jgi:type IV pilus assembly protein PilA